MPKPQHGKDLPPDKLKATDWAILKHVSLYHFTIRHAVQKLFFADGKKDAGTVLAALARQGYLKNQEKPKSEPSPPTKKTTGKSDNSPVNQSNDSQVFKLESVKYYLLGEKSKLLAPWGFKFPKERLVPPNTEQSLYKHLAALWYCVFDRPRRYRLDQEELKKLWADIIPKDRIIPHQPAYCLANDEGGPAVYRLYPTQKTKAAQIVEEVRKKLENDANNLGLESQIDSGRYGYAIAVPSVDRQQDVERELDKQSDNSLLGNARLSVHYAPSPSLLAKALKDLDGGANIQEQLTTPDNEPPDDEPPDLSFSIQI